MLMENLNFEYYYKKYSTFVIKIAFKIINNIEDAADICQEVFIKFYRYLPIFKENALIKSWLYITTKNTSIDLYRKNKKEYLNLTNYWNTRYSPNSLDCEKRFFTNNITHLFNHLHTKNKDWHCIYFLLHIIGATKKDIATVKNTTVDNIRRKQKRAYNYLTEIYNNFDWNE
jgi:RNA polymerase sigma factor, sigma-70 family